MAIDQWAISKAFALQNDVVTAFRNYEFHEIYQEVHNFCVVELGGFYLDIIKDRLYTTGAESLPRRSAQTAMYHLADAMVRWLAPILSFTAEEVWSFMPGERNESVFLNTWHRVPAGAERGEHIDWPAFIALKADVARQLERLRDRQVRSARRSRPRWRSTRPPSRRSASGRLADELRFLLITSQARVVETDTPPADCRAEPRRERLDRGQAELPAEVRAMLASAQRRRQRSAPSGTLRALRRQHRRARRGA